MIKTLPIAVLRTDGNTQPRATIYAELVDDYTADMQNGDVFPPVTAFHDGAHYWLADGFHRVEAAGKADKSKLDVQVHKGTQKDAAWFACSANRTHGRRRSNQEKRQAVERAILLQPSLSDRAVGRHVGVDHKTVAEVRKELDDLSHANSQVGKSPPETTKPSSKHAPEKHVEDDEPEVVKDKIGRPIPVSVQPLWVRRGESLLVLEQLRRIKNVLVKAQDDKDPLYAEVMFSAVISQIERSLQDLEASVPHAVCTTCQGLVKENCRLCCGRGLISEHRWKLAVPKETKDALGQ